MTSADVPLFGAILVHLTKREERRQLGLGLGERLFAGVFRRFIRRGVAGARRGRRLARGVRPSGGPARRGPYVGIGLASRIRIVGRAVARGFGVRSRTAGAGARVGRSRGRSRPGSRRRRVAGADRRIGIVFSAAIVFRRGTSGGEQGEARTQAQIQDDAMKGHGGTRVRRETTSNAANVSDESATRRRTCNPNSTGRERASLRRRACLAECRGASRRQREGGSSRARSSVRRILGGSLAQRSHPAGAAPQRVFRDRWTNALHLA